jgi:hypothetical protein
MALKNVFALFGFPDEEDPERLKLEAELEDYHGVGTTYKDAAHACSACMCGEVGVAQQLRRTVSNVCMHTCAHAHMHTHAHTGTHGSCAAP